MATRKEDETEMTKNSKIEWTDHTFNPWIGCAKISDGCKNCYAEAMMDKRYGKVKWGVQGKRIRTSAANWKKPLEWNRQIFVQCVMCGWRGNKSGHAFCPVCGNAECRPVRARVFCASLADVFEDKSNQPEMNEWRRDLFEMILATPSLDWLLLTKRPENIIGMASFHVFAQGLPSNVRIGTSVENQEQADKRIPELLKIKAAGYFLSMEPLLGAVDFRKVPGFNRIGLDLSRWWVIVGGESGANARPMHPAWVRSIRDQCMTARVPFFFKQWGEWKPLNQFTTGELMKLNHSVPAHDFSPNSLEDTSVKIGKHAAGRLLDGREWNQFPRLN